VSASLDDLRTAFAELTGLHGWAPLQTPRNLLLALTGRVGAVASLVQWEAEAGPDAVTPELRDEVADCLVYLVALADALGVDVVDDAVTRIRGAVGKAGS
jgi:dCTP diphosphatase